MLTISQYTKEELEKYVRYKNKVPIYQASKNTIASFVLFSMLESEIRAAPMLTYCSF